MHILPHIVVAGLGRCGSSLTMQMLAATGVPTLGTFPDFECMETLGGDITNRWLAENAGMAVKILNPHLHTWPKASPRIVVWLSRKPEEQAKSQIKFVAQFRHDFAADRQARRAATKSIIKDTITALQRIGNDVPMKKIAFEEIIENPLAVARGMAKFIGEHRPDLELDALKMAAAVIPRQRACLPDMAIEARLLARMDRDARLMGTL